MLNAAAKGDISISSDILSEDRVQRHIKYKLCTAFLFLIKGKKRIRMRMNSQTADAEKTVAQMQPAGIPSLSFFILSIKLFRIFLCAQHLAQNRGYCDQRFDFDEPNVDRRGRYWYR